MARTVKEEKEGGERREKSFKEGANEDLKEGSEDEAD